MRERENRLRLQGGAAGGHAPISCFSKACVTTADIGFNKGAENVEGSGSHSFLHQASITKQALIICKKIVGALK